MANVLIVDDLPTMASALSAWTATFGHRPTLASSGAEALALIRREPFALVILDHHMPGMSGMEVLRRLRADSSRSSIPPIVMFSADPDCRGEAMALGAMDCVSKTDWTALDPFLLRCARDVDPTTPSEEGAPPTDR